MGCEPRGFGWTATVEVCSARVTRLVTDLENFEKFSGTQLVPGTGWQFASIRAGRSRCLAPDVWTRFASISTRGLQRCLAPGWGADLQASGHGRKGAWHRLEGWFASIQARLQRCLAPGGSSNGAVLLR
jgi:hypothetical protein